MKVFDARRLGAVGLCSNRLPYRGCVRDGVDGVLPDNPTNWLEMIDRLLADHNVASSWWRLVASVGVD